MFGQVRTFFAKATVPYGALAASVVAAGLVYYAQVCPAGDLKARDNVRNAVDWSVLLPSAIDASTIPKDRLRQLPEAHYVKRVLEEDIKRAETDSPDGSYAIVYGPKGVGKSSLAYHVAGERKGVVLINVTDNQNKAGLVRHLIETLLGPRADSNVFDTMKLATAIGRSSSRPVTIIFDVERDPTDGPDECLMAVRSLVKTLAKFCRCVIILSESNAVVEFGKDPRESFVYVGELTASEARELLRKMGCTLSDKAMGEVFAKIGTSPMLLNELIRFLRTGATYETFIAEKLVQARGDLAEFPLKPILKALKEHPDGVSVECFAGMRYEGVDLCQTRAVAKVLKYTRNPIVFDMKQRKYRVMSTPHRTALASYEPCRSTTWVGWTGWWTHA